MSLRYSFYILILILTTSLLNAQSDSLRYPITSFEDILEEASIDEEDSQLMELLESVYENPVNINKTNADKLLTIPLMDINTARKIINHRKKYGDFFSTDELYSIDGINKEKLRLLLPFLTAEDKIISEDSEAGSFPLYDKIEIRLRSRAINNLQTRRGFSEGKYLGSKIKSYQRLKLNYADKYKLGVLSEKDDGESSFSDFASAYLEINNILFDNKIIGGDYLVEFGQGLAVWSPYAFSKGSDAVNTAIRSNRGITSYTSADENQFFRGLAFSGSYANSKLAVFYSSKNRDANIENNRLLSLPISGYHRTDNELGRKNSVKSNSFGVMLDQNFTDYFNLGLFYYQTEFAFPFAETGEPFELTGSNFKFYSASYQFIYNDLFISGEFAYNGISVASINAMQIALSDDVIFSTSVRSYPRNYTNLFSQGFGESSTTQNEVGFYSGISWDSPIGSFDLYFDQFKFPYANYTNPLPSVGNEFMGKYEIPLSEFSELSFRFKQENKELSVIYDNREVLSKRLKRQFRSGLELTPNPNLRLRTRFDYVNVDYEHNSAAEEGFLIFEDVRITLRQKLDIYGRFIFFSTDSYESRVYEFENDLRGRLTNKSLFDEGLRWYLFVKYEFIRNFELSIKYSESYKPHALSLSSGYRKIPDNLNHQLSIQLDAEL